MDNSTESNFLDNFPLKQASKVLITEESHLLKSQTRDNVSQSPIKYDIPQIKSYLFFGEEIQSIHCLSCQSILPNNFLQESRQLVACVNCTGPKKSCLKCGISNMLVVVTKYNIIYVCFECKNFNKAPYNTLVRKE